MHLPHYPIAFAPSGFAYEFVSIGPKGGIPKLVLFTEIEQNIYNLAFGDKTGDTSLDDLVKSANGDTDLLLSTVASIAHAFLDAHPNAIIYAKGSTDGRTRLYQTGINRARIWMDEEIAIYGNYEGRWEPFAPGRNYEAFFATKQTNFKL